MCGIAGIYRLNKNIDLQYNPNVLSLLQHRGPNAHHYQVFYDAVLYHTRLSIIDLSEQSNQPFFLGKDKCIVYNGEIFNYKELSKYIERVQTSGDVEVLIKYFDKYKISGLHHLNGFFAFAFYDNQKNELYVVRDRYGEKPLYYYLDNDIFVFASEIHSLLELIQKKLPINTDVLYTYFRLHYIAGEHSILKGIKRLLPGHYIYITSDEINIDKWYDIHEQTENVDLKFDELLSDAVQKRLISDAPIGAFLSGGLDSSIVAALAKKNKQELHTFSLGYKNEKLYNETSDAAIIAKHIGSIHHNFEIDIHEIQPEIISILNKIDEPFADSSAINVYFLSQKIKPYATVALSGDGADELLMGYNKHKIFLLINYPLLKLLTILSYPFISVLPDSRTHSLLNSIRKLKKMVKASQLSASKKYIYLSQWAEDAYIHQLFKSSLNNYYFYSLFEKYKEIYDEVELFNTADLEIVLPYDMLYKIDFFGMQNAVEIRSPYLDYRVVEKLYYSSFHDKINNTQQKYLLRKTFSHLLPSFILSKRKQGFEIPLHKIILYLTEYTYYLDKDFIQNQNIFDYTVIHNLIEQMKNKNTNDASLKLWTIIVFQAWYERFKNYIAK